MVEFNPNVRRDEPSGTTTGPYRPIGREPVDPVDTGERAAVYETERPAEGVAREPFREPLREPVDDGRVRQDPRSIGDLFREMAEEGRLLLKQELNLVCAEMVQKGKAMARHGAYIAIGGALAYAGLLAILAAVTGGLIVLMALLGIGLGVSLWLSPLIVGVVVALIGYAMYKRGKNGLAEDDMVPHRTTQTMRENATWMHERVTK